jgi:hypothetical protein
MRYGKGSVQVSFSQGYNGGNLKNLSRMARIPERLPPPRDDKTVSWLVNLGV